jgi:hypothetical protein
MSFFAVWKIRWALGWSVVDAVKFTAAFPAILATANPNVNHV